MKSQELIPWIRLAGGLTAILILAWYRRDTFRPLPPSRIDVAKRPTAHPVFIWGDWHLEGGDRLVLPFRVERELTWWLTIDGESSCLSEPTIMPKNFLPGQAGRIEMRFEGLLEASDDDPVEFGIRYCTTTGTIETQRFTWLIWRDPIPIALETAVRVG